MATNKPVDLDPAMERRFAMKVAFPIPDAGSRLRMWQSLLPEGLELAPDVDLARDRRPLPALRRPDQELHPARDDAVAEAEGREDLHHAGAARTCGRFAETHTVGRGADLSAGTLRSSAVADLQLRNRERDGLQGAARAWQKLKGDGLGLTVLISTSFIGTGVRCGRGPGPGVRPRGTPFNYSQLQSATEFDRTGRPADSAEADPDGVRLLQDAWRQRHDPDHGLRRRPRPAFDKESNGETDYYLADLKDRLRSNTGLFCMVTPPFKPQSLPLEFHLHFVLEHPSEDCRSAAGRNVSGRTASARTILSLWSSAGRCMSRRSILSRGRRRSNR